MIFIWTLLPFDIRVGYWVLCVSSQLFDSTSLDHIKTFKTERPVNSAAISPIMDHVSEDSHNNVYKNKDCVSYDYMLVSLPLGASYH